MLLGDSKRWRLDYVDGRTLMFRWSPDAAWTGDELLEEWNREAFAPTAAEQLPDDRAVEWPAEPSFWDQYLFGVGPMPLSADTARWQQASFMRVVDRKMEPPLTNWQATMLPVWYVSFFAPSAGAGPAGSSVATALTGFACGSKLRSGLSAVDLGPPALPIVMERNVRRALLENPRHPAVRALQVDLSPYANAEESYWIHNNPNPTPRVRARTLQRIAALQDALILSNENPLWHRDLALAYANRDVHLLDAAVEQLDLAIRSVNDIAGEKGADAVKMLTKDRDQLRAEVDRRRANYELKAAGNTSPMNRVRLAMYDPYPMIGADNRETVDGQGRGLALEALRILQSIDPANLPPGERLNRALRLVDLNLRLGRVGDATAVLSKADVDMRKMPPEVKLALAEANELISISTGWYKTLDKSIEVIEDLRASEVVAVQQAALRNVIPPILNLAFSEHDPIAIRMKLRLELDLTAFEVRNAWMRSQMILGDVQTLRGIFLLEQGNVAEALRQFERATSTDVPFADRQIAERYRDLLRRYAK